MSEFRTCRVCGYGRGFHVYFRESEGGHKIGLICPQCGQSYDLGWLVSDLSESPEIGAVFEG